MKTLTQQHITENPALQFVLSSLSKQLQPKPKLTAEKADPYLDEPPRCYACKNDPPETGCGTCGGSGNFQHEEMPSVFLEVQRGFDTIPCQASIKDGQVIDCWCVCDVGGSSVRPPRYGNGTSISLLPDEEDAALRALKEAS